MVLLDREDERAVLDGVLGAVRDGLSGALVLRGESGIGKTALLDYAVEAASGFRVERLCGIESEMELGFAALHQMLLPFLARLDALPAPQKAALRAAFGLADDEAPNRFLVGLASLTLLADAAARKPLLCIVDDAEWLDQESAEVLAFVARRLYADRIGMIFAVRDPIERQVPLEGLTELVVRGLPEVASRNLFVSVAGGVDGHVAERVVTETRGNPLALVELGAELAPEQLAGGSLLPEPLPLSRRLEARFLRSVSVLPRDAQTLLLLAAADPTGDPALLWRAAARLHVGQDAAVPLEAAHLLTLGPTIGFRHPLIRSAVYHGASSVERRAVHDALAAATDPELDADRRAWHRAGAVDVDEAVAHELEEAADRARRRGGYAAAAAFLTRAARMTPDENPRVTRLLAAGQAELTAGAPARAHALLEEATPHLDDQFHAAQALRLQGAIRFAMGHTAETTAILLRAARALEPFDVRLARETLLDALSAAIFGGRVASGAGVVEVARAARAAPPAPQSDPTIGDLLLDGLAVLFTVGHREGAPLLRRALVAIQTEGSGDPESLRWLGFGCWAAGALGDNDAVLALATRLERLARDQGALVALTRGLYFVAMSELVAGSLATAGAHFAEARDIMAARGDTAGLGDVIVQAWRGREAEARAAAASVTREATIRGQGGVAVYADYALAVLELSLGNYKTALEHAQRTYEEDSYFLSTVALPDLVEAAARSGVPEAATAALERLSERALVNATPLALGLLARARAVLADDNAEMLFAEAIDRLAESRATGHLARAHLVYGEWLRRQKRRRDAREQLRRAFDLFEGMGAEAFAERARVELLATGETARKRTADTRDDLTPQEAQIARLAGSGATNPEIAAQLFISPSTVEYHLRKVFRKLDITSRRQLARTAIPAQ